MPKKHEYGYDFQVTDEWESCKLYRRLFTSHTETGRWRFRSWSGRRGGKRKLPISQETKKGDRTTTLPANKPR